MRHLACLIGAVLILSGQCYAESARDEWSKSLSSARYSNQDFVKVTGVLDGAVFERRYPLEGPDGLYPVQIEMTSSSGEIFKDVLGVIKDTKAPEVRDLQYPRQTLEDTVTVSGFVDNRPFSKQYGISGRSGEYFLDLDFCDEAQNCYREKLKVIKDRKYQKLFHWELPELQLPNFFSGHGVAQRAPQALISLEKNFKQSVQDKAPKVYAMILQAKNKIVAIIPSAKDKSDATGVGAPAFKPLMSLEEDVKVAAVLSREAAAHPLSESSELAVPDNAATKPIAPASNFVEAPVQNKKDVSPDYQFGITRRVRMPDEKGGMTIIIDNHRTGQRTLIRKDLTGKEQSYENTEIPENERQRI